MGPVTRIEMWSALFYRTLPTADKLPLIPLAFLLLFGWLVGGRTIHRLFRFAGFGDRGWDGARWMRLFFRLCAEVHERQHREDV